jgi:hypothetical protein
MTQRLLLIPALLCAGLLAQPASASSRDLVVDDPVGDANVAASSEAKLPQAGAATGPDGVVIGAGLASGAGGTSSPASLLHHDIQRMTLATTAREVRWSLQTVDRPEDSVVLELYGGSCGVLTVTWTVDTPTSRFTCAGVTRYVSAPDLRGTVITGHLPRGLRGLAEGTRYTEIRATTVLRGPATRVIVDTAGDNSRTIVV